MPISGKEMLKLYLKKGWVILRQRGSHVIVGKHGRRRTIPLHKELSKGLEHTLRKEL